MKRLIPLFIILICLLVGCSKQTTYTDNGNPGQIKVTVFYDDNKNGKLDSGETGAPVEAGIS